MPTPQKGDDERTDCQQDDAGTIEVGGPCKAENGREETCRERGKAEGKIALDKIGGQQASALARPGPA